MNRWLIALLIAEAIALFAISTAVLVLLFVGNEAAFQNSAISGLIGALIGGGFSIGAQMFTARAERGRADNSWVREHDARVRAELHGDVRDLLTELTDIHREAQLNKPSISEIVSNASWAPTWGTIWTDDRSLRVDVLAELVRDAPARAELRRTVSLLDAAENVTQEDFPGHLTDLRRLALNLVSNAIMVCARYLRQEPFVADHVKDMAEVEAAAEKFKEYDRYLQERAAGAEEFDQPEDPDDEPN